MITITGKNIIAGIKSSKGNNSYHSINPKTFERSKITFTDANQHEIDKALEEAKLSFMNLQYKTIPLFLKEVSHQIMQLGDQLLEIANWETALGLKRLENERIRTCTQIEKFAEYIEQGNHWDISIDQQSNIKSMNVPIGPILVFPASNFPFAFGVCGGDTVSAWAAGCPAIVKAHPSHPQTSELFAHGVNKAIEKQQMPKGFFSLLHGKNPNVSKKLVLHPRLEAIGFTGSFSVGNSLFQLATSRTKPIPVYAEMGSINPMFIVSYQNDTPEEIANSITIGSGQFCTKPGVIFVTEETIDIIGKIIEKIKKIKQGILLNENIKKRLATSVYETRQIKNVEVLVGGNEIPNQCSFDNTLLITDAKTYLKHNILHHEHFGPVALFVKCKHIEEFIEIAKTLEGQLTASIYTQDTEMNTVKPLFKELIHRVGRIIINGVPTGVKVCTAMTHGGPYPATTAPHTTSVGMKAIRRFLRPISFQNVPSKLLPEPLQ
ncbi:MAG: aldehyde dehydrogenase family protein [Thermoplasmatota archaeon]